MSCRLSFKKDGLTCRQRCRRAVNEAIWEEVSISWNCERLWIHIMFFFLKICNFKQVAVWSSTGLLFMSLHDAFRNATTWGGIWLRPPWFVNGWRELDFCFRFEERKHCPLSRWRDSAGIAKPCKDCCCCCCCVFLPLYWWGMYLWGFLKALWWWFRIRTSQLWNKDVFPICKLISILLVTYVVKSAVCPVNHGKLVYQPNAINVFGSPRWPDGHFPLNGTRCDPRSALVATMFVAISSATRDVNDIQLGLSKRQIQWFFENQWKPDMKWP